MNYVEKINKIYKEEVQDFEYWYKFGKDKGLDELSAKAWAKNQINKNNADIKEMSDDDIKGLQKWESEYQQALKYGNKKLADEIKINIDKIKNRKEATDSIDIVAMDIPLLTRILEYFNENKMDDVKLHEILTRIIEQSKTVERLGIEDYNFIINNENKNQ